MNTIHNYKQLGCAIAIQAAKDYDSMNGVETSPARRRAIIKDLRSDYMDAITGGLSVLLADALRRDHKAVVNRIKNMEKCEEETQCRQIHSIHTEMQTAECM